MSALLDKLTGTDSPDEIRPDLERDFPADIRDEIAPDPQPGRARGAKPSKPAPAARRPVTVAVKKRVTDELDAYVKMAALAWSIRDDHCGPVLNEQSRAIAESLAELIARNPALVAWVETSGMIGDWVKLWMAVAPVVSAVREHHVVKKVDDESAGGAPNGFDPTRYAPYRTSA